MTPVRAIPLAIALACSMPAAAAAQGFLPPPAPAPMQPQAQPSPFPAQPAQPSPFPSAAPAQPAGFPPIGAQPGGFPSAGGGMSPQECGAKFLPLRTETERRGGLLKTATEQKVERAELCKLFRSYSASESTMLKFMLANQSACNIPPNIVDQVKTGSARTAQLTKQVCNTAAAGPPPAPSLSDALGTSRAPATAAPRGGSTFNTLTGNPLSR